MKQRIRLVERFFSDKDRDLLDDVWLFVQRGESYQKLKEDPLIGSFLSDNDVIYLVEDRFFGRVICFQFTTRMKRLVVLTGK